MLVQSDVVRLARRESDFFLNYMNGTDQGGSAGVVVMFLMKKVENRPIQVKEKQIKN